jgi:Bacterial SH3 domain
MNLLYKILALSVGVCLNVAAFEISSCRFVSAQQLCSSYRVARAYGLYVYIQGGSKIITTLPYNNIVSVVGLSSDGHWAKIQYLRIDGNTGEGWVTASFLDCYQE